jgi:hypothetical protein
MSDETAPQPPIKITWLVGTFAAFAIFAVIGAYSSRMTHDYLDYDQDRAAVRYETLGKVRHDEGALLSPVDDQGKSTAEWVDQGKGLVRIPIVEAMAKEIDTLKSQPAAAGCEIPGAVPAPAPASTNAAPAAGAPAPTAGATNAAPAKPAAPTAKSNAALTGAGPAPATTPSAKPTTTNK